MTITSTRRPLLTAFTEIKKTSVTPLLVSLILDLFDNVDGDRWWLLLLFPSDKEEQIRHLCLHPDVQGSPVCLGGRGWWRLKNGTKWLSGQEPSLRYPNYLYRKVDRGCTRSRRHLVFKCLTLLYLRVIFLFVMNDLSLRDVSSNTWSNLLRYFEDGSCKEET